MLSNAQGVCWSCGAALSGPDYQREAECPQCRRQSHVCRNCRFYAPGRPNDCREPVAEPVKEKDRANFCGYFEPSAEAYRPGVDAERLNAAAEDLFNI